MLVRASGIPQASRRPHRPDPRRGCCRFVAGGVLLILRRFGFAVQADDGDGLRVLFDEAERLRFEAVQPGGGGVEPLGSFLAQVNDQHRQGDDDHAGKDHVAAVFQPALLLGFRAFGVEASWSYESLNIVVAATPASPLCSIFDRGRRRRRSYRRNYFHLRDSRTLVVKNKNTAVVATKNTMLPTSIYALGKL